MSVGESWRFLITVLVLAGAIGFILAYIGIHFKGDDKKWMKKE